MRENSAESFLASDGLCSHFIGSTLAALQDIANLKLDEPLVPACHKGIDLALKNE